MLHEPKLDRSALGAVQNSERIAPRTSIRRATGPRTAQGKQKSKRNATKHGVFSALVLPWESTADYESLLTDLQKSQLPEGALEELLVEKLAMIAWRLRRLLAAESAEIQTNTGSVNVASLLYQKLGVIGPEESPLEHGLMRNIQSPGVLEHCLKLLNELRRGIEDDFDEDRDAAILEQLYGVDEEEHSETLFERYMSRHATAQLSEEERQRKGYATPEQCKQSVLDAIDAEIKRLELYRSARASMAAERAHLENFRRSIPAAPWLDRLLRYEASLERSFDRTLNQLERLQRMRRGQPVAPRIDLNLSAS